MNTDQQQPPRHLELAPPPDDNPLGWMIRAACTGADPELFFPGRRDTNNAAVATRAKAVCSTCPVKPDCLDYALDHHEEFGIWGGATEKDRRVMQRARRDGVA